MPPLRALMTRRPMAVFVSTLMLAVPGRLDAQAAPASAAATGRADLATAYWRMDHLYAAADSTGRLIDSLRAQVNRTFDRATFSFFGGRFGPALASIDSALLQLSNGTGIALPSATARSTTSRFRGDERKTLTLAGGTPVPLRLLYDPSWRRGRAPVGLLLALHGAGGEPDMFIDAYGQGVIADLALANRLVLVSPATGPFVTSAEPFDSVVAMVRRLVPLDSSRVYVLGHSMGAGAAAQLAQQRPQQIAAVACLAGGRPVTVVGAPRLLFLGAALDPIIPAKNVRAAAEGSPTGRYEELPHEGHTLMVRRGVLRAVPWLVGARP